MLDITFLFKCRQGLHALDPSDIANELHPMRRTRSSDKGPIYTLPLCKTETFANSSFNRVVPSWNALAVELRLCTSLSTFKRLLKKHYTTIFDKQINPSNTCSWVTKCRCLDCRLKFASLF